MTTEEYSQKMTKLELEHKKKRLDLMMEYAYANNGVKVGDKFTDHIGTIIVEKIKVYVTVSFPSCIYFGLVLKADGTLKKNGEKRWAYQSNKLKA